MPRVQYSKDRRIVLLDQQPLREEAGGEAKRILREVNEHAEKLAEFDRTILPAFERWEAETLGTLLDEERRLKFKISELEGLLEFADFEALFTGRDPYEIFEEAQREFANDTPRSQDAAHDDAPPPEPEPDFKPEPDPDEGFDPEERDFRSYVRFVFGDDPDSLGKRKYQRLFEDYRRWREKMGAGRSASRPDSKDAPARVKEIYRILVRRLHPDTGRDRSNPQTRRLWDDLQDAYASQDLERLEVLLAITDLHENGSAVRSTLYHIRQVARQLRTQLDGLKLRLLQAKKSPAWTLWHAKNRESAEKKLRATVEKRVESAKIQLADLEAEVARWKEEADRKKARKRRPKPDPVDSTNSAIKPAEKPASSKTRKKKSSGADEQDLFDFA
jgi:DNA replication initiation complex subunit (GINS family)